MAPSFWQLLIVLAIILLLFGGRGKISALMGDFGRGLKSFKKSVKDDEEPAEQTASKTIEAEAVKTTAESQSAEQPKQDKAAAG